MTLSRNTLGILSALCLALAVSACGNDSIEQTAGPNISVDPAVVLFNTLQAGQSETSSLTISNRGEGSLLISSMTLTGANVFTIADGYVGQPIEILPNEDHAITFLYEASGDAGGEAFLRITHNDVQRGGETTVPISIQESAPRIFVNPNPVNFGRVPSNTEARVTATMTNIGGLPLTIRDYFIVGGAGVFTIPDEFVADPENPLVLPPNGTFEFPINYLPVDDGFDNARLIVKSDDPDTADGDYVVEIQANGAEPCIEIAPQNEGTYDFGQRVVGQTTSEIFIVRNCSDVDFGETLVITSLGLRDDSSEAYAVDPAGDLLMPLELVPGEVREFLVDFTPQVDEQFEEGWLVAVSNDVYSPELTIQLNGLGTSNVCPIAVGLCTVEGTGTPAITDLFVLPLATLACNGNTSSDSDGSIVEYIWTVAEAPAGSTTDFVPNNTTETSFFVDLAGRYTLNLEVVDDRGCVSPPAAVTLVARPDEDIHVQLVWSTPADPDQSDTGFGAGSDLDLHVVHPNGCWEDSTWDCHFRAREPNWGNPARSDDDPSLDIDDTDGAGPENINLDNPESGTNYRIGVHYYNDHGYGVTYATLRVYIFGELVFESRDKELYDNEWWVVAAVNWPSTEITPIDLDYSDVPPCGI
ncbi:MAG: hypothetical protein ACJAYU_004838 [Bradymonadia bacterium]|jgi:hypothetical protein